jgi:hypothetical protein
MILYPSGPSQHVFSCRDGCFNLGGSDVVLNATGSLTSDWTAQGALGITPTWHNFTWSGTSETLFASNISSGSVTFSYTDFAGRAHSGGGNVVVDDALSAALARSSELETIL